MRLIYYLIKKRTQSYFSLAENWKTMAGDALMALLCVLYAAAFIILYRSASLHPGSKLNPDRLLKGLFAALLLLPIMLTLFPNFSLKKPLISAHFPLSKINVALTDLICFSIYRTRNATLLLMIIILPVFLADFRGYLTLIMLLIFLLGIVLAENIRNSISFRKYFISLVSLICIAGLYVGLYHYHAALPSYEQPLSIGLGLLFAFSVGLYLVSYQTKPQYSSKALVSMEGQPMSRKSSFGLLLTISFRNTNFIIVLLIALFFKLAILFTFLFRGYSDLGSIVEKVPFVICLILPVILFSYIYNNAWGYFYGLALNNLISQSGASAQIQIYLALIAPPLLVDAIITFICLALGGLLELKIIVLYLLTVLFSIPIGMLSSFSRYFPVNAALDLSQFRGKTSRLYSFALIVPAMFLGLAYNHSLILNILLLMLFVSSFLLYAIIVKRMPMLLKKLKKDIIIG